MDLTILTRAKGSPDEGSYGGRYMLTVYEVAGPDGNTQTFSGKVSCAVE